MIMDQFKETTLEGHIQLCELRYKSLEDKINALEQRLTKVEADISSIKRDISTGFSEVKLLIEKQSNARHIQILATSGSIIVALLGTIGYMIAR